MCRGPNNWRRRTQREDGDFIHLSFSRPCRYKLSSKFGPKQNSWLSWFSWFAQTFWLRERIWLWRREDTLLLGIENVWCAMIDCGQIMWLPLWLLLASHPSSIKLLPFIYIYFVSVVIKLNSLKPEKTLCSVQSELLQPTQGSSSNKGEVTL